MKRRSFPMLIRAAVLAMAGAAPLSAWAEPGVLSQDQLMAVPPLGWLASRFEPPVINPNLPIVSMTDTSPEASILRQLDADGKAAGFSGVVYDNRDRGHSLPDPEWMPNLRQMIYGPKLSKKNLDYGLAGQFIMPAIVLGNSSTAITRGKSPRSQPRLAMTTQGWPQRSFMTYVNNHIYLYPEHKDYDAEDRFPANWPYMVITQGSSHSDRPFLRAIGMSLAAFTPETREFIRQKGLIGPTMQMILRRSQKGVYDRQAYMSLKANPTAFSRRTLVPERMVSLAAALTADSIPPMVRLAVDAETFADAAGLAQMSEKLFDTPSAVSRIWRSEAYTQSLTVSADQTVDPNGRPLSFTWAILSGDPGKVRIIPQNQAGTQVKIEIDWHDKRPLRPNGKRLTNRVDIAVFAWNGVHDSAPAFVSVVFPTHQLRRYDLAPDGAMMRLSAVSYNVDDRGEYYDPELFWSAAWSDKLTYDSSGTLTGRERIRETGSVQLAADGLTRANGKPVRYSLNRKGKRRFLEMK